MRKRIKNKKADKEKFIQAAEITASNIYLMRERIKSEGFNDFGTCDKALTFIQLALDMCR